LEYNKLIIFDLDGVLIDSKTLHHEALNKAITDVVGEKYIITQDEHLLKFDGMSTKNKLAMLATRHGWYNNIIEEISSKKQEYTQKGLWEITPSKKLIDIFKKLKEIGFNIAIASNAIRETVTESIIRLGLYDLVNYYISNEDVIRIKPFPEMYWECMKKLNAIPKTTLILEDSHIGREGAINSGAFLLSIRDPDDVTWEKISVAINQYFVDRKSIKWVDKKMNVVIPMAGAGSRFLIAGYTFPKPLIEVKGKPMIQVVTENLNLDAHFIYIVQKDHYEKYNLKYLLNLISPGCDIIQIEGMTDGAARTVLKAVEFIDNENPLVIANSDQFIEWDSNKIMYSLTTDKVDGGLLTFTSTHPKWSFAKVDDLGYVTEIAEKKVISDIATVGVYYWKNGSDFVKYANQMIDKDIRTNGEFYVAPVMNEAILDGKKFVTKKVDNMWGIGVPEDLNYFLTNYKGPI
jgi:HAD superfamily hydrolase (TIGR01509 family)